MKKWYWTSLFIILSIIIYAVLFIYNYNWIQIWLGILFGYISGITINDWENNKDK